MVIEDRVSAVMSALQTAGREEKTLSFGSLYALFEADSQWNNVYDTLECASRGLADLKDAIPSVLVVKSGGLPGIGFFEVFRNQRREEYEAIAGADTPVPRLTQNQRERMAASERARVYAYATTHFW